MTTHIQNNTVLTVKAAEPLAINKMATVAGTIAQANTGFRVAGLCVQNVGSGYHHGLVAQGVQKAYVGATVASLGFPAALANSGWLTNAVSGGFVVGRFLETAASGDLVQVLLDTANIGQILA
jgi:ApbE superfamily uncharacterized protein (UPF0280 family)